VKIVGLYHRHCVSGPRAELAAQLVRSDPGMAIVRSVPPAPATTQGGTGAAETAAAAATAARPNPPRVHRVVRGETLRAIARRYGCDLRDLARLNRIKPPRFQIRSGQTLKLGDCRG
jgi:membrane-bound lytic murein transglycosylase D